MGEVWDVGKGVGKFDEADLWILCGICHSGLLAIRGDGSISEVVYGRGAGFRETSLLGSCKLLGLVISGTMSH